MSEQPYKPNEEGGKTKRRRLNADEIIKKAEATLAKGKAEKQSEIMREVKEAVNGAGIDFHPREWRVVERKDDEPSFEILYIPTNQSFSSAKEATKYLEREGNEGARAHLILALMNKLKERGSDLVNRAEHWSIQWFEGCMVYQYLEGHRPTFANEAEALDFALQGHTARDEDIADEFRGVLSECDGLLDQVSALLGIAMNDLLNISWPKVAEEASLGLLNVLEEGYDADDDDDDEDYSEDSSDSEMAG